MITYSLERLNSGLMSLHIFTKLLFHSIQSLCIWRVHFGFGIFVLEGVGEEGVQVYEGFEEEFGDAFAGEDGVGFGFDEFVEFCWW